MKILNFTAVEILPALLSNAKTQTIRPAWKVFKKPYEKYVEALLKVDIETPKNIKEIMRTKPARFKVGDKVKLLWQQRSKYKQFCRKCGLHKTTHYKDMRTIWVACPNCYDTSKAFNKHLGNVEITEVFKIEMTKEMIILLSPAFNRSEGWRIFKDDVDYSIKNKIEHQIGPDIPLKDGFSSAEQMFEFFDKKYDLSQPKVFWVYRWVWSN